MAEDEAMNESDIRMGPAQSNAPEPTLTMMLDAGITAAEKSAKQLNAVKDFLADNPEDSLPVIVRDTLRNNLQQIYYQSMKFIND